MLVDGAVYMRSEVCIYKGPSLPCSSLSSSALRYRPPLFPGARDHMFKTLLNSQQPRDGEESGYSCPFHGSPVCATQPEPLYGSHTYPKLRLPSVLQPSTTYETRASRSVLDVEFIKRSPVVVTASTIQQLM